MQNISFKTVIKIYCTFYQRDQYYWTDEKLECFKVIQKLTKWLQKYDLADYRRISEDRQETKTDIIQELHAEPVPVKTIRKNVILRTPKVMPQYIYYK